MDGLIKDLLEYLKNTPEEQKRKDWKTLAKYGRPDIITVNTL